MSLATTTRALGADVRWRQSCKDSNKYQMVYVQTFWTETLVERMLNERMANGNHVCTEVFICGAGPVGLLLAYSLARQGISSQVAGEYTHSHKGAVLTASRIVSAQIAREAWSRHNPIPTFAGAFRERGHV